jgi:hypothetical protein
MWTIEPGTITFVQGQNTYALPSDTIDLLEHVIRTGGNAASTQADLTITRISVSNYATIPNTIQQARPIQIWIQRYNGQLSPTGLTIAGGTLSASNTTVTLDSTVGLPATGFIKVDNEIIGYGAISGNTLTSCVRGQDNTTAATHTNGTAVYWSQVPAITVWPTPDGSQPYQLVYWRLRRTQDAGDGVNVADVPFRFVPCMVAGLAYYLAMKVPGAEARLQVLKAQYDEAWALAAEEDREKAAVRFVPRRQYLGSGT